MGPSSAGSPYTSFTLSSLSNGAIPFGKINPLWNDLITPSLALASTSDRKTLSAPTLTMVASSTGISDCVGFNTLKYNTKSFLELFTDKPTLTICPAGNVSISPATVLVSLESKIFRFLPIASIISPYKSNFIDSQSSGKFSGGLLYMCVVLYSSSITSFSFELFSLALLSLGLLGFSASVFFFMFT